MQVFFPSAWLSWQLLWNLFVNEINKPIIYVILPLYLIEYLLCAYTLFVVMASPGVSINMYCTPNWHKSGVSINALQNVVALCWHRRAQLVKGRKEAMSKVPEGSTYNLRVWAEASPEPHLDRFYYLEGGQRHCAQVSETPSFFRCTIAA